MTPKIEGYMTTAEAAEYLNITPSGVRHHLRRGNLPNAIKVGRDWLIPIEDLDSIKDVGPGRPSKDSEDYP